MISELCFGTLWEVHLAFMIIGGLASSRPFCSQSHAVLKRQAPSEIHHSDRLSTSCVPVSGSQSKTAKAQKQVMPEFVEKVRSVKDRTPKEVSNKSHPAYPARLRTCGCRSSLRSTYPGNLGTVASAMRVYSISIAITGHAGTSQ